MVVPKFKFLEELLEAATKHLEAVAKQQKNESLTAVAQNLRQGHVIESEPVFVSVAQAYEKLDAITPAQKADTYINLAAIRLNDKPGEVKEALQKALELDAGPVQALALLGHLALRERRLDEAHGFAQRAAELEAGGAALKWQAVANEDLGVIAHMKGDLTTAQSFYTKAIAGFEQVGDETSAAEATGNLGLIMRREKKFKEALALFEKSLVIWQKTGREKDIIHTLGYLGSLHFVLRDFRQAIDIFTKRAEFNFAKDDKAELAADYANRGNAWSKLANKDEAHKDWQQAKGLYEQAGKEKEAQMMAGLLAA